MARVFGLFDAAVVGAKVVGALVAPLALAMVGLGATLVVTGIAVPVVARRQPSGGSGALRYARRHDARGVPQTGLRGRRLDHRLPRRGSSPILWRRRRARLGAQPAPRHPPAEPESFDAMVADLDRVIVPGLTQWQHPSFFAYFPANTSYPAILGDLAAAGLGVNGMSWATSPACTELETLVLDWMVDLLGLPERFRSTSAGGGVIQGSASEATLCAILAARERVTAGAGNRAGGRGDLVAYATAQAHSSIEKGVRVAGIGSEKLRVVAHDEAFAMRPDALASAISEDRGAGRRPFFVCATAARHRRPHSIP